MRDRYIISDKLDRPRIIMGHCGHCGEDDNDEMKGPGFLIDIDKKTIENENFREVVSTNKHSQLVVMSVAPNDELGEEVHKDIDQFFRVEKGTGKFVANGVSKDIKDGDAFIIPAGTKHNVINTSSSEPLKVYTIYSPPHHPPGTVEKTKADAEKKEPKIIKEDHPTED
jgi:mannose-6-phosphate isomerase-like protein (cupin superfamily)